MAEENTVLSGQALQVRAKHESMTIYNPSMPPGCPPSSAWLVSGEIWRGVKKMPMSAASFLSEAERGTVGIDLSSAKAWGLSIWCSEEAALHARKIIPFMRKWHLARGEPTAKGVMMKTPSNDNTEHHTWWKPLAYDPAPDFVVAIPPLKP